MDVTDLRPDQCVPAATVCAQIPAFQSKNDERLGPFNPAAELLNGRAAMIGFASLLVAEAVRGGVALF